MESSSALSKVEELRPCTQGYSLQLKVLASKPVQVQSRAPDGVGGFRGQGQQQNQGQMRIAECIVGDDTGVVLFTARNEQKATPCTATNPDAQLPGLEACPRRVSGVKMACPVSYD